MKSQWFTAPSFMAPLVAGVVVPQLWYQSGERGQAVGDAAGALGGVLLLTGPVLALTGVVVAFVKVGRHTETHRDLVIALAAVTVNVLLFVIGMGGGSR